MIRRRAEQPADAIRWIGSGAAGLRPAFLRLLS